MAITKTTQFAYAAELECRECNGTGEDPASTSTVNKRCPLCEGTGRVVRVVRGTVEIISNRPKRAFPA